MPNILGQINKSMLAHAVGVIGSFEAVARKTRAMFAAKQPESVRERAIGSTTCEAK
jgi:hypothetical protein